MYQYATLNNTPCTSLSETQNWAKTLQPQRDLAMPGQLSVTLHQTKSTNEGNTGNKSILCIESFWIAI